MITVNHITIANMSEWIQNLRAKAVARETTTEEWTEGIPPLHSERSKFIFPVEAFMIAPLIITERKNVTAGTRIMFS